MSLSLNSEFQIGSIVTLKSHYTRGKKGHLDDISIAGDDKSIPPFMLVTEILKEVKNKFDEDTGEKTIQKDSLRLKVIWFNAKSYEFKEKWISSNFVDVVENEHEDISFSKADLVILKTNLLEIKKQRVSIKEEDWKTKPSKSSLLSFCAPEMVVIGKSKFKPKDPLFDKVTNERIREIPNDQLKCQYYNPIADKYSEVILPIECFEKADVKTNILNKLIEANKNEDALVPFNDQLFSVKNISYLHGVYMIQTKNFIDETEESYLLKEFEGFEESKVIDCNYLLGDPLAPKWKSNNFQSISKFLDLETKRSSDKDDNNKKESNSRPILNGATYYIHYKNLKGKFTKRFITIQNVDDFIVKGKKGEDKSLKGYMVQAFCHLRKEERTFTFTDERLLAIYDVNIELDDKNENKLNIKKLLSDIKVKSKKNY